VLSSSSVCQYSRFLRGRGCNFGFA